MTFKAATLALSKNIKRIASILSKIVGGVMAWSILPGKKGVRADSCLTQEFKSQQSNIALGARNLGDSHIKKIIYIL